MPNHFDMKKRMIIENIQKRREAGKPVPVACTLVWADGGTTEALIPLQTPPAPEVTCGPVRFRLVEPTRRIYVEEAA